MPKRLKELYLALQKAMTSSRLDEDYLQYIDSLQDEIQKIEETLESQEVAGQP
jgi:hypothetical protein